MFLHLSLLCGIGTGIVKPVFIGGAVDTGKLKGETGGFVCLVQNINLVFDLRVRNVSIFHGITLGDHVKVDLENIKIRYIEIGDD